jgi:hypothetical protein
MVNNGVQITDNNGALRQEKSDVVTSQNSSNYRDSKSISATVVPASLKKSHDQFEDALCPYWIITI